MKWEVVRLPKLDSLESGKVMAHCKTHELALTIANSLSTTDKEHQYIATEKQLCIRGMRIRYHA